MTNRLKTAPGHRNPSLPGKMATTDGCFSWLTLRIAFVSSCLFCGNAVAANLVPDPGFASVSELGAKADSNGWNWQRIEEPCEVRVDQKTAALTGGKVFLHSASFPVDASTVYELQVDVSGDATFSLEILWWRADGLPTQSHRSILGKPNRLNEVTRTIRASARSPVDGATAYIRCVVEEGRAVVKSPVVRVAGGTLLLKLDAAAPGPQPTARWRDLTGRNQDLKLQSVRHSAETSSFVFDKPGASCIGHPRDAARFDFETDQSAGPGQGSPFTIVLYAKLMGRSGTGIINKFGKSTKGGWSIGLVWDEFGLDRISTLQSSNKKQNRTINGFPGLAGQDVKLGATDRKFHMYVIHVTGSGARDGTVYFDGSDKTLSITPWPFGSLTSGSVRNQGPLRIGSLNRSERGFRGEIGFVEIWSGTRLRDGMTPAAYSRYRFNRGKPARARSE